jgi:hypothetical protein
VRRLDWVLFFAAVALALFAAWMTTTRPDWVVFNWWLRAS